MVEKEEKISESEREEKFLIGLLRAFAGAILFSFPMIMTMELWEIGFTIPAYRLIIMILFSIPLLTGLSYFVGFKETENIFDDIVDAFVGYAVGFISSALLLYLFGIIDLSMSFYEIVGKVSIQAVTAAIGAMYAQSELGHIDKDLEKKSEEKQKRSHYWGELFLMLVGGIFLAMNPASTEEIYLIAFKMEDWQTILLIVLTLLMIHAFVYTVGFKGREQIGESSLLKVFLRFTVVGYAIALLISFYLLWTFGSLDGMELKKIIEVTVVLAFPAALGVAASRLIV